MLLLALLATGLSAPLAPRAHAQAPGTTVIYLVRHAETVSDGTGDPALSAEGRARASRLARMLAGAGLDAVHATAYRRTPETAAPVAAATGLTAREYDPRALEALARRLLGEGGRHLVVGHSNTTPELVDLLGGASGGPIGEEEYGRVYVLTAAPGGVHTARLGYPGEPSGGAVAPPERPAAAPADVESMDAILAALYDVISGPAGQPRDWDRLRSLFLPTARLIPVQRAPDGTVRYRALTVDEYIEASGPTLIEVGFREREIARRIDEFGHVAQVFSTYEGHREGMAEPLVRGLNSIQLIHDGQRWWISSLAWSPERPDLPVPARYEGAGGR